MVIESLLYWLSLSLKYYLASEFSFSESEATLDMQVVGCDDGTRCREETLLLPTVFVCLFLSCWFC